MPSPAQSALGQLLQPQAPAGNSSKTPIDSLGRDTPYGIAAADGYGLPVSTTHVLSSGIAGTMAANGSGLQMSTIRNIVLAWVLTLPAAMTLSGTLYFIFWHLF